MKKIAIYLSALILVVGAFPTQTEAKLFKKDAIKKGSTIESAKLNSMIEMLKANKDMDKSAMSVNEKKHLGWTLS